MPESDQRRILGPGRHKVWQDGDIDFGDIASPPFKTPFGPGRKINPLRDTPSLISPPEVKGPLHGTMICQSLCKSRIGYGRGHELRGKKWEPTGAGEGRIERVEKDGRILVNAGSKTKPKWVAVHPDDVVPIKPRIAPYRVGAKAKAGLNDDFGNYRGLLTAAERKALGTYQGPAYSAINNALRRGARSRYASAIDLLDSALKKGRLSARTKVYRGVTSRRKVFGTADLESLIGREFSDFGFVSTTTAERVAVDFAKSQTGALIELHLPEGTNGAWLRRALADRGLTTTEDEFILPRGMRFRIAGVKRSKHGPPTIIMEVIG